MRNYRIIHFDTIHSRTISIEVKFRSQYHKYYPNLDNIHTLCDGLIMIFFSKFFF